MNAGLLAALINSVAIPELTAWLATLHHTGIPITDAVIIAKLATDTDLGEKIGTAWLTEHSA